MITLNDVKAAAEKVSSYVRRTPLWKSETLSKRFGTNVYLKMELFQKTGSFKPRGAFNQMLAREKDILDKGAVASVEETLRRELHMPVVCWVWI